MIPGMLHDSVHGAANIESVGKALKGAWYGHMMCFHEMRDRLAGVGEADG